MTINALEDRFLTVRELAKRYGRTVDGIYKMIRRGAFPAGGSYRASSSLATVRYLGMRPNHNPTSKKASLLRGTP